MLPFEVILFSCLRNEKKNDYCSNALTYKHLVFIYKTVAAVYVIYCGAKSHIVE